MSRDPDLDALPWDENAPPGRRPPRSSPHSDHECTPLWSGPRDPLEPGEEPALDLLYQLFLRLRSGAWRAVEPNQVTPTQAAILYVVATAGVPLSPSEIARVLRCSRPTVSRSIRSLENKGWVRRYRDPLDRRRRLVSVSRSAHRVAAEARDWDNGTAVAIELNTSRHRAMLRERFEELLTDMRRLGGI